MEDFLIIDGKRIPYSQFNDIQVIDGRPCKINKTCGYYFNFSKESVELEIDYKKKFCAYLCGTLFHWFDTLEELEKFQSSETAIKLQYTYYYPE